MAISRRNFMKGTLAASTCAVPLSQALGAEQQKIRIGVCDWSFGGRGNPAAMDAAKVIGLQGIQISPVKNEETLSYAQPAVQETYKKKMAETGMGISSVGLTLGNNYPIATDPNQPAWLEQTVDAAHALGVKNTLLAFFGKGNLLKKDSKELDEGLFKSLVERLKKVAPRAKEKGVSLGIESWLSAEQCEKIMDAVGGDVVKVYYDIANTTKQGYDVPAEIRRLGKERINEFHFKDSKGRFDSGRPALAPIVAAIKEIKYEGWLIMERSFEKDAAAYFKHNASVMRKLFGLT